MEKIVELVAAKHSIPKKAAKELVNSVLDSIVETVKTEGKVSFIGFGSFSKVDKPERQSYNPTKKATVTIPATTLPKFKAGSKFKQHLKEA